MLRSRTLQARFTKTIFCIYLLLGGLAYLAFYLVTSNVVHHLGTEFAVNQALLEKSKLMSAIQHDLSLSLNMADSPVIKQWAQDEKNPRLRRYASEELATYKQNLSGHSLFLAIRRSGHYYFADGKTAHPLLHPRYTLHQANLNDAWFFKAMRAGSDFALNVDHDNHLNVTKVWFNVAIRNAAQRKIGLCGGAIDITRFIKEIVDTKTHGVETILFRRDGAITGDRNSRYVLHNSQVRGNGKLATVFDLLASGAGRRHLKQAIAALAGSSRGVQTLNLTVAGRSYLAAVASVPAIHWYNLVLVNPASFVSSRNFLPVLAVIILSTLAVIASIALLLNRLVLSPLSALAASSAEIARGNFAIRMPVRSRDEIGSLTRSFNTMTRMVRDYTENLETKVRERTEELDHSNRQLAESNRQILDSIHFAQLIQAGILPGEEEILHYAGEFFVLYRPRDIVGGDFYYFRPAPEGCYLAVIDCTGHGVPGAFMTMTAKAVLDRVLDEAGQEDPAAILKTYNAMMQTTLHQGKQDLGVDNGLEIGLCRLLPAQGRLLFAGARIDLLLATPEGIETIAADRQAIGYRRSAPSFDYTCHSLELRAETTVYMTSDGLLDQAGGDRGWGFGRKRLEKLLGGLAGRPAGAQQEAVSKELARYQGKTAQRDDITIIGFKCKPATAGRETDSAKQRPV